MRMNGKINGAGYQFFFQFFGKKAFALQFIKTEVQNTVALCFNDLQIGFNAYVCQAVFYKVGLPQGQFTAAGSYDELSVQLAKFFASANLVF